MLKLFPLFLLFTTIGFTDVKSTTGEIKFNTQADNQAEMTLNNTGLGIGTTPSNNLHVAGNAIITDSISVGGGSGSSNLNINGSMGLGLQTVTSSTLINEGSMILADTSLGNITLSLPEASSCSGRTYTIKKINESNHVLIRDGGYIDTYSDISLNENYLGSITVISHSGNWMILNLSGNGELISSDNLVGWWKLDDASGITATDSSPLGIDGTLDASMSFSTNSITSLFNSGLDFDGSDDEINFSEGSGTYDFGTGEFTLSMWVKPNGAVTGNYYSLIEKKAAFNGTNPGFQWWLDYRRVGVISLRLNDASTTNDRVSDASTDIRTQLLNDGNWHHIATVVDLGNDVKHYHNGVLVGSVDISALSNSIDNDEPLTFNADHKIELSADELRVYSRALSVTEILSLYHQGQ